jgi:hypothetical protein
MMNLPELIERLQEAHAALGNQPNAQVRIEWGAGLTDDDYGTTITGIEIEAANQLVVIRG